MKRYLLLILLTSWSLLIPISQQCDSGIAVPNHVLSIQRSLLSNADVAVLKEYNASSVETCMEECCSGKFGSCTVVSYKKSTSQPNCLHFNCLPVHKCKFLSSNTTDSFTFSSEASVVLVPSVATVDVAKNSTKTSPSHTDTTPSEVDQRIPENSLEERLINTNDTHIQSQTSLEELLAKEDGPKSSIKPRKGVSLDPLLHESLPFNLTKSKVKPRKGVGPAPQASSTFEPIMVTPTEPINIASSEEYATSVHNSDINDTSEELMKDLENVFQDESRIDSSNTISLTPFQMSIKPHQIKVSPPVPDTGTQFVNLTSHSTMNPPNKGIVVPLKPSIGWRYEKISISTPRLDSGSTKTDSIFSQSPFMTTQGNHLGELHLDTPKNISHKTDFHLLTQTEEKSLDQDTESQRKYKASMRLVLSLIFGLLVLFGVLAVIAKRMYDGWLRRHYRRMDFLIDGMYNGYG